jgi:glycosyltransferase involved in cell wall biosynthesis
MKRILLIATEFAPGMIPYASSIINTLSNSEKFEVFAIVVNSPNIIRLNRFIEDAEVRDLFTKAAIVVYPYRSATMSGVLSLAFYFRKKVVMSDVPFFKEYANRDSLFFKAGNVEDLADKLQQALDSGSASTNANLYPEFYSENILEQDYINLYSSPLILGYSQLIRLDVAG